jgi:hypothetical protein
MSVDMRQVMLGALLLIASSLLLFQTGVDGRLSALLAAVAVLTTLAATVHSGVADDRRAT